MCVHMYKPTQHVSRSLNKYTRLASGYNVILGQSIKLKHHIYSLLLTVIDGSSFRLLFLSRVIRKCARIYVLFLLF